MFEPAELPPDEVHLWRIELATVVQGESRWQKILSPDEQTRAARFHFARDRQRFAATRALLRIVLGGYVGSEPEKLVFSYLDKGKPFLNSRGARDAIEFNVSHSGDVALLAIARGRPVGVDVEQIRENLDPLAIAHRYFSPHEQSQLGTLEERDRYAGFFRCWTRKEAYIKARGDGLSVSLNAFDVSLKPGNQDALLACRIAEPDITTWLLREVTAGEGYAAALCVQGRGWQLQL
jgi:4'-phosphopantetheinyl transferase